VLFAGKRATARQYVFKSNNAIILLKCRDGGTASRLLEPKARAAWPGQRARLEAPFFESCRVCKNVHEKGYHLACPRIGFDRVVDLVQPVDGVLGSNALLNQMHSAG